MSETWTDYSETCEATCCWCGHEAACRYTEDPYMAEVYDEHDEVGWWCYDCWSSRLDEV